MRGGVVVEFGRGEELYPFGRVIGTEDAEIGLEFLIGLLHGQRNQISSSAHSSVVQRHVELLGTWFSYQRRREVGKT